jgi:hypothetical protein
LDKLRTIRDQAVDSTQKYFAALDQTAAYSSKRGFRAAFFVRLSPFSK